MAFHRNFFWDIFRKSRGIFLYTLLEFHQNYIRDSSWGSSRLSSSISLRYFLELHENYFMLLFGRLPFLNSFRSFYSIYFRSTSKNWNSLRNSLRVVIKRYWYSSKRNFWYPEMFLPKFLQDSFGSFLLKFSQKSRQKSLLFLLLGFPQKFHLEVLFLNCSFWHYSRKYFWDSFKNCSRSCFWVIYGIFFLVFL